jgi:hypothetical protein
VPSMGASVSSRGGDRGGEQQHQVSLLFPGGAALRGTTSAPHPCCIGGRGGRTGLSSMAARVCAGIETMQERRMRMWGTDAGCGGGAHDGNGWWNCGRPLMGGRRRRGPRSGALSYSIYLAKIRTHLV